MELKKSSFTKKEIEIYEYIHKNSDQIIRETITSLALSIDVSQPTITRFCKKLGYDGYNEFMLALYSYQKQALTSSDDNTQYEYNAIESYTILLNQLDKTIQKDQLSKIASSIINADNVLAIGSHKSNLAAELLRYNLIKFGINCSTFSADDALEINYLNSKDRSNVIIIFSAEGYSLKEQIKELNHKGTSIVLFTMNEKALMRKYANLTITLPNSKSHSQLIYTENVVTFLVLIDILTSVIATQVE